MRAPTVLCCRSRRIRAPTAASRRMRAPTAQCCRGHRMRVRTARCRRGPTRRLSSCRWFRWQPRRPSAARCRRGGGCGRGQPGAAGPADADVDSPVPPGPNEMTMELPVVRLPADMTVELPVAAVGRRDDHRSSSAAGCQPRRPSAIQSRPRQRMRAGTGQRRPRSGPRPEPGPGPPGASEACRDGQLPGPDRAGRGRWTGGGGGRPGADEPRPFSATGSWALCRASDLYRACVYQSAVPAVASVGGACSGGRVLRGQQRLA